MAKIKWRPLCIRGPNHIAIACVPKVAHTSIQYAVLTSLGYSLGEMRPKDRRHPALNLCHAKEAVNQNYKIFAFVRDPFDRLISVWANRILGNRRGFLRKTGAKPETPFATFVMEYMTSQLIESDIHMALQADFVPEQAIIFRYEAINDGWAEIQKIWPGLVDLQRFNVSMRGRTEKYETPELKQKCRKLYAIDYERFGYD